jgi:hypothetical protein
MNESRKLELSKETLRCLDDQDLTGVVGGDSGICQSGVCQSVVCKSVVCNNDIDIL